jgi:hypothetical protein
MMRTWEWIKLAIIFISVQVFISEAVKGGGVRGKTCLHLPGMLTLAQGMQEWSAEPLPDNVTDSFTAGFCRRSVGDP